MRLSNRLGDTMSRYRLLFSMLVFLPIANAAVDTDGFVRINPDEIVFAGGGENAPAIAVLAGDPEKEGFYLLRAKFAPGVMSLPHYHSTDRHVTVISGTWYTGTGREFDRDDVVPLAAGSYMMHPAGAVHYDGAKSEEVIVEIKGIGPATTVRLER
jgi:quercetin dioxygenase-like cupin family protein